MVPTASYSRPTARSRSRVSLVSLQSATLLCLLAIYVAIVLIGSSAQFDGGDDGGYVAYALRIAHIPQPPDLRLWWGVQDLRYWWGPGYPLVLAPFALLGWPWLAAKLLNAFFLVGALAYIGAVVRTYTNGAIWLVVTLCLGLCPPFMQGLPSLNSENLAIFLVCGFMFHFCALFQENRRSGAHLVGASLYIAYLALTKIFFGYVIATVILFLLLLLMWQRTRSLRNALGVFLLALLWCVPYLSYMYSVTGKVFYWGTSGGSALYWMTSPYPGEYGSWYASSQVRDRPELAPHREFFASLEGMTDIERDAAFKREAVRNIKNHPKEYVRNWAANVGRLLFSYPFSFGLQGLTTYFYLVPDMFIVVLFVLSMVPAVLRPQAMPFEFWFLLAFALISFGGTSLVSGYERQFRPLAPILCVWIGLVSVRALQIELRPLDSQLKRRSDPRFQPQEDGL